MTKDVSVQEIYDLLDATGCTVETLLEAVQQEEARRESLSMSLGFKGTAAQIKKLSEKQKMQIAPKMTEAFKDYIHGAWNTVVPGRELKWNWHLDHICELLVECSLGLHKRAVINVPPRTMKSMLVNVMFPTWRWTWDPSHQFNNYSHSERLAVRDSLACRRLITSEWYKQRWGDRFELTGDQSAKAFYQNSYAGHRIAFGIGSNITGAGADTQILDDLLDAKAGNSEAERYAVNETLDETLPSRFNDYASGCMILIMQRLHEDDPAGHLMKKWDESGLEYALLCYPMQFDPGHPFACNSDIRTKPGELLWESRFPEEVVDQLSKEHTAYAWAGQYQQRPSPKGGGILKSKHWRTWDEQDGEGNLVLPNFKYILQSYDTAFTAATANLKTSKAAYSARTTWGIFDYKNREHMMLIECWRDQVSYPDLRKEVMRAYNDQQPDAVLIEKKASGISLIQDMRQAGLPILDYTPDKDKITRAHAASPYLESGCLWVPPRKWAEEFIQICAAFPAGDGADYVDTMTQAVIRIRNMHILVHPDDPEEWDEPVQRTSLYG